jgi:four helix bundle protein
MAMQGVDENNAIKSKSFAFAVRVVNLYKYLSVEKKEKIISRQILRSGTSIGANTREALACQTKPMFAAKMNIALSEAHETDYWIDLLNATSYLSDNEVKTLKEECVEIIRLLTSIIKTARENMRTEQTNEE